MVIVIPAPPVGVPMHNRVENIDGRLAGATSTAAMTASSVYLYLVRTPEPILVHSIQASIGATAAGASDFGIYTFDGTNFNRVANSGAASNSVTSALDTRNLTADYLMAPGGDYWLAVGGDASVGTWTVTRVAGTGVIAGAGNKALVKANAYSSGLPTQISSPAGSNTVFWLAALASGA